MTEYRQILKNILETGRTWRGVKFELSKYNVHNAEEGEKDTRAGKIFEVLTQLYFRLSPTEKDNYKNVWLFEEVPSEIRTKLNLGNQDYGADLILEDIEGKLYAVQCKFKNDESSRLNWTSDKIANLYAFCPTADHFIVFSNAADLDKVSKSRHDNFTFYSVTNLQEIHSNVFKTFHESLIGAEITERTFYKPKPHQEEAIKDCIDFFGIEQRGQLILPCGAGKTYTALWIKEGLESKNSLILVPSLALLRQIKNEWANQRKTTYQYLCVCSESDIDNDVADSVVAHTYEIDTRVTTDPFKIKSFLKSDYSEKVIFSTYHSLQAIAEAIANIDFEFDFIFCDEAHKTAGVGMNKFSLVHDNNKIPSKRRLYATATPRIVKESLKKKLGDDLKYAYDMNDSEIFGHEFYRMTFKDAIEQDILVDYKIVAVGVNSEELKEYIENRRFIDARLSIDELANNYALDHIMKKYSANHGLTFHSRVKLAAEFADRHSKLFPDTSTFAVSGEQPTSQRNITLNDFKNADKAIVSNARCLTEGVDVPTIDLVYFCDPKNSKVDIVQAVGRALRKKEGKKIGLVVVPIYHSKRTEVEDSISSGSFKNLLQVIRSLCDQDERLQDEINSLAYGKGRRSSRIDIVSGSFIEEQDTILLEGFEERLKNSLFDQIVDKTSNNWDLWFLKLKELLDANQEYPTEKNNKELYRWVAQQRTLKTNGKLANEEIRKLNSINFIWNYQEWKWNQMYDLLLEHSQNSIFEPTKENEHELYRWYVSQKSQLKNNTLDALRTKLLLAIKFKGSHKDKKWYSNFEQYKNFSLTSEFEPDSDSNPELLKWMISQKNQIRKGQLDEAKVKLFESIAFRSGIDKKWEESYEQLLIFKDSNENKWPQYNRSEPNAAESKLSVFCQTMRKRYRENELSDYWFDKMVELDFNFGGKTDNWAKYYEEVKNLISNKKSISIDEIGSNAYQWIVRNKKNLDEGTLSEYQTKKIQSLDLDRFFESWEERFEKVSKYVEENGKLPTKHSHSEFNSWLYSQRSRYKKGTLREDQIASLTDLGFDLEGLGNEKKKARWIEMLQNLKSFKEKNGKWPSFGSEGLENQMYNWCLAQRQTQAGTASGGRRKPLKQWQVEKLNSIEFVWNNRENDKTWDEWFQEFTQFKIIGGSVRIPSMIEGKRNPLYAWWAKQKHDYKNNNLLPENLQKLKNIGINEETALKSSSKDGFTKWANKLKEIADFVTATGHYPKAGLDKEQGKLYQSLARTKRAFKNNVDKPEQEVLH